MQTLPSVDEFVATDIQLRARFASTALTVDDAAALFQLLKAFIESVQREVTEQTGHEVYLLPVLSVRGGSIEVEIKLKVDSESAELPKSVGLKAKLRAIFLGAFLALAPGESAVTMTLPQPPPPVSEKCQDDIRAAADHFLQTAQYLGRGFTAKFEGKCGDATISTQIEVPATSKKK